MVDEISVRAAKCSASRFGFTLIEMLVALAVFALAAMALLNLSGESTRSAARVEARTLGGVVAENVAAEAMIAPSLPVGETAGEVEMAGRVWRWRRVVTGTELAGMGRIDVRVSTDEGQVADRVLFRAAASLGGGS
jgi:general secretion pathway protein I